MPMQRPQEPRARENLTAAKAAQTMERKTAMLSHGEDDFEVLSTQCWEEDSAKMSEKKVKLPGAMKVKAVMQRESQETEGSSPEIRRFSLNEATFKALMASVRSVFNIGSKLQCSLFWKDDDGDLIQFSTDGELRHAMDNMPDETLRVRVTIKPDAKKVSKNAGTSKLATLETPTQRSESLYPPLPTESSTVSDLPDEQKDKVEKKVQKSKRNDDEFNTVRQQVPEKFRGWVRQYVRAWFGQGAETANQIDTLPEGAPRHFRQWLHDVLSQWTQRNAGLTSPGENGMKGERQVEDSEELLLSAPEGLPPLYYRWISLFLPRFYKRYTKMTASASQEKTEGHGHQCPKGHGRFHGHGAHHGEVHHCHGKAGGKRGDQSSSSESEDSDSGEKMWKKVPKEFRKYVRVSVKQMHKNKGDNPKAKEKATRAGLSPEVLEFVEQILLEWHAKLSQKRPRDVATEMMEGERSLPTGLEKEHFLWMCRFMARWHRRHAGKCDVMSAWSSGDSGDSSSGEDRKRGKGCGGHRRHCRPAVIAGPCPMMHRGCPPPLPTPVFSCMTPPPPPPFAAPGRMNVEAGKMGFGVMSQGQVMGCGAGRCCRKGQGQGCHRGMNKDAAASGSAEIPQDIFVERVTEGVKKM